jgi:hypothetical protein
VLTSQPDANSADCSSIRPRMSGYPSDSGDRGPPIRGGLGSAKIRRREAILLSEEERAAGGGCCLGRGGGCCLRWRLTGPTPGPATAFARADASRRAPAGLGYTYSQCAASESEEWQSAVSAVGRDASPSGRHSSVVARGASGAQSHQWVESPSRGGPGVRA